MKNLPQISEAEFEVMKIVWKYAPINTYEKQSRVFVYTPLVKECEYISQESNSFLNRYYNGDITSMLSAYIENDKLSETEIETLRSLLSKSSKKGGD